tara:strand:+ start:2292 stop:3071 length:780 start_codon:yes stop_codon:yes gene_type:complete
MFKSSLVSVIMNCHNSQKYLKQSISSVINQSYKNWEIILWDNKSTDKSREIVKSFKNKKIKYFFSKKLTKLGKARNLAVKKAKGKYVAFIDTDDTWPKNKLKIQMNFLKKNKLKICFTNFNNFYQKTKIKERKVKKYIKKITTQSLLDDYPLGIITVIMEKSLFKIKKFNEKLNILEDFDLFIHLSCITNIGFINKVLADYRIHGTNLTIKKNNIYINELKKWIKDNENKFLKKNISLTMQKKYLIKLQIKRLFNLPMF